MPAPRLFVLAAPDADAALVLRQGPGAETATILWDLARDRAEPGERMQGRLWPRRADLSADASRWVWFAAEPGPRDGGPAWTGLAEPPRLAPLAVLEQAGVWLGGGLFAGPRALWLNGAEHPPTEDEAAALADAGLRPAPTPPGGGGFGAECPSIHFPRLMRDGWRLVGAEGRAAIFERPLGAGWRLETRAEAALGAAPNAVAAHRERHALRAPDGRRLDRPGWRWVGVHGDDLILAEDGLLKRIDGGRTDPARPARVVLDPARIDVAAEERVRP